MFFINRGYEPYSARIKAMFLIALVLLIYKWRVTWPRMLQYRTDYIEHADEPDKANPALDELNRFQARHTVSYSVAWSKRVHPAARCERTAQVQATAFSGHLA